MTRFSCPTCKAVLQASPEQAGKTIACPKCKTQMRVPSVAPVAKSATQPTGPTPDWLGDVACAEQKGKPAAASCRSDLSSQPFSPRRRPTLRFSAGGSRLPARPAA